jgi:hypothetical protein
MAEGLSAAAGKMKTINEDAKGNSFASRADYLAHRERQRLSQIDEAKQEDAAPAMVREKASKPAKAASTDNKSLRDISASLKTIQAILKGMAKNSESHLRAISKKLDRGNRTEVQKVLPKKSQSTPLPVGTTKDKIISGRYLAITAAWQNKVAELLHRLVVKKSPRAPARRSRAAKAHGDNNKGLAGFAKYLATAMLGVGAGALAGMLVGAVIGGIKAMVGGVASAVLAVGKLAVVGMVSGVKALLGGIASVVTAAMSKLASSVSSVIKAIGTKGVEVAKSVVNTVKATAPKVLEKAKAFANKAKEVIAAGAKAVKTNTPKVLEKAKYVAKTVAKVAKKDGTRIVSKSKEIISAGARTATAFAARPDKGVAILEGGAKVVSRAKNVIGAGAKSLRMITPVAAAVAGKGIRVAGAAMKTAPKSIISAAASAIKKAPMYVGAAADTAKDMIKSGTATRAAAKAAGTVGSKGVIRTLGKAILKKLPVAGAIIGVGLGARRAMQGDWKGAGAEVGSGIAATVPGAGTAASIGADAWLVKHDMDLARESKLKVAKTSVMPMTRQLEASQQRNDEAKDLREKRMTESPNIQSSTVNNTTHSGSQQASPRLSARNPDSTVDFLRKVQISGTILGQGFIIS